MHVYVHGKLSAHIDSALRQAATASIASGVVMVVHLNAVRHMTAAGLGVLLGIRRQALDAGLTLSLAGLTMRHRFMLHAWCAQPLFDEWESTIASGRAMTEDLGKTTRIAVQREQDALPAQNRARG
jgi:anti-anti-sigma factor